MSEGITMSDKIEIYVRNSGDRTLLNFYIPSQMREAFLSALQNGAFEERNTDINLELSVLDNWRTDTHSEEPHIRVPISAINIQFID
jgi:hypothetical protein